MKTLIIALALSFFSAGAFAENCESMVKMFAYREGAKSILRGLKDVGVSATDVRVYDLMLPKTEATLKSGSKACIEQNPSLVQVYSGEFNRGVEEQIRKILGVSRAPRGGWNRP